MSASMRGCITLLFVGTIAASAFGNARHATTPDSTHLALAQDIPVYWAGQLNGDGSVTPLGSWWALGEDAHGNAYGMTAYHVKTALAPGTSLIFGLGSNFYTAPGTMFQASELFEPPGGGSTSNSSTRDALMFSFPMGSDLTFAARPTVCGG